MTISRESVEWLPCSGVTTKQKARHDHSLWAAYPPYQTRKMKYRKIMLIKTALSPPSSDIFERYAFRESHEVWNACALRNISYARRIKDISAWPQFWLWSKCNLSPEQMGRLILLLGRIYEIWRWRHWSMHSNMFILKCSSSSKGTLIYSVDDAWHWFGISRRSRHQLNKSPMRHYSWPMVA